MNTEIKILILSFLAILGVKSFYYDTKTKVQKSDSEIEKEESKVPQEEKKDN